MRCQDPNEVRRYSQMGAICMGVTAGQSEHAICAEKWLAKGC